VFDLYFEPVNRYCLRRTALDDVNDVTAEVFAVAWRKVGQIPHGGDALPWLYGVARNEINNRRRTVRRRRALATKLKGQARSPELGPEPEIIRASEVQHVLNALGSLKPDDQELLLLRTHEELDFSQMAIAIGCSPEAARKRFSRAMTRLRKAAEIPEPHTAVPRVRAINEGGDQ
jgi:RNA polymerase sigma-70 factor (ECF subfamily)